MVCFFKAQCHGSAVTNPGDLQREINMALKAGATAEISEKCPQGGIWYPAGSPDKTRSIGIGNTMPPTPNGESHWVLKTPTGDN
ncbi:hypothetical protein EMIT0324P_30808 [Pseudomonas chlororaphis]